MAGRPGFEPGLLGSEPRVLPLNHLPPLLTSYQIYNHKASHAFTFNVFYPKLVETTVLAAYRTNYHGHHR